MTRVDFSDGVSADVERLGEDEFIVRYIDHRDGSAWTSAHDERTLRSDFLEYVIRDILNIGSDSEGK